MKLKTKILDEEMERKMEWKTTAKKIFLEQIEYLDFFLCCIFFRWLFCLVIWNGIDKAMITSKWLFDLFIYWFILMFESWGIHLSPIFSKEEESSEWAVLSHSPRLYFIWFFWIWNKICPHLRLLSSDLAIIIL